LATDHQWFEPMQRWVTYKIIKLVITKLCQHIEPVGAASHDDPMPGLLEKKRRNPVAIKPLQR
jgi:hypothetical protein